MSRVSSIVALSLVLGGCGGPGSENADTGADTETGDVAQAHCETPASESFVRPFGVDPGLYPFESCAMQTKYGLLHYVDEGPRDAAHTVLMVHGNPTWSFLYRNIASELIADGHRVVIPDHLGMGMSDVPSTASFDYRPRSHSAHLEDLVVALDLDNVTLVVQDWGGPIGLGMATRQPERIASMLVMNTWAWSIDPDNPGSDHGIVDWYDQAKQFEAGAPGWFCLYALPGQAELMAAGADPSMGEVYEAVIRAYIAPAIDPQSGEYVTDEPCAPMQIFAESILDDNAYQAEVEAGLSALEGVPYGLLTGQSDILFGALRCDVDADNVCPGTASCECVADVLPSRVDADCSTAPEDYHVCVEAGGALLEPNADRFSELLGGALVLRESIPQSDHMVQEDAPDRVVAAIRTLIEAAD